MDPNLAIITQNAMLLAIFDPSALATWIVGGATICTMVFLAALGSYMGSVRSVGKIEVIISNNHGETMTAIAALRSDQISLRQWVEDISKGDTPHIATINAKLDEHGRVIDDHGHRLTKLEIEHAAQMGRSGCQVKANP